MIKNASAEGKVFTASAAINITGPAVDSAARNAGEEVGSPVIPLIIIIVRKSYCLPLKGGGETFSGISYEAAPSLLTVGDIQDLVKDVLNLSAVSELLLNWVAKQFLHVGQVVVEALCDGLDVAVEVC